MRMCWKRVPVWCLMIFALNAGVPSASAAEASDPFLAAVRVAKDNFFSAGSHVRMIDARLAKMEREIETRRTVDPELTLRLMTELNALDNHLQANVGVLGNFVWRATNERLARARVYIQNVRQNSALFYAKIKAKDQGAATPFHLKAQADLAHLSAGITKARSFLKYLSAVLP